jgi:hypothetical protein
MSIAMPQLDYAAPPSKKRRWVRRVLVGLLLVIAAVVLLRWTRGPLGVWHARQLLYACARYSPNPATPIYTEDPLEQAQLPNYATAFKRVGYSYYTPQLWKHLNNATTGAQISGWGTIFLHEMRKPDGQRRVVGVDFTGATRGWMGGAGLPIHINLTERLFDWPWSFTRPGLRGLTQSTLDLPQTEGVFRVLPGQVDPADPSHFTIPYTVDGKPFVLDGWLKDNDSLVIEPRAPHP